MEAGMRESQERRYPGIRLVQAGYHTRSLALYLKLGSDCELRRRLLADRFDDP